MAHDNDSPRWRDEFPQLTAGWLTTQAAVRRVSRKARQAAAPSAWTTALMAGGLALLLSLVLLFVKQPPAANETTKAQGFLTPQRSSVEPPELDWGVERLAVIGDDWEEISTDLWTSTTPRITVPSFAVIADNWTQATPRPIPIAAVAEPYFYRAEPLDFEEFTAATITDEVPTIVAGPEVDRDVGVVLERSPASTDQSGALAYTLNVKNLDAHPVDHVRVVETVPVPEFVLDTNPPAYMTPDGALVWQLANLQPLESRTMTVTLDGSQVTGPLETVAALDVETQFSVKTQILPLAFSESPAEAPIEPEMARPEEDPAPFSDPPIEPLLADDPPPRPNYGWSRFSGQPSPDDLQPITPELTGEAPVALPEQFVPVVPETDPLPVNPIPHEIVDQPIAPDPAPRPLPLDTAHPPQPILSVQASARNAVRTGDVLTTEYQIKNDGDAPAEGIVLTVFVPPELRHKHGNEVEHRIPRLLPGETRSARLLTKAAAEGTAELDALLSLDGRPEDEHRLQVRVVSVRSAKPAATRRPR